jgi:hypothetical protein
MGVDAGDGWELWKRMKGKLFLKQPTEGYAEETHDVVLVASTTKLNVESCTLSTVEILTVLRTLPPGSDLTATPANSQRTLPDTVVCRLQDQ